MLIHSCVTPSLIHRYFVPSLGLALDYISPAETLKNGVTKSKDVSVAFKTC